MSTIDHDHPRYRDGERAAHVLLDLGVLDAGQVRQLLANLELTTALAFHSGAEDRFLKATGMRVTLDEYLQELGC
jgi:hypothetical protein